ncbi:MAG: DUF4097 domain-containing protein [Bacteroidetes bacterium]|nr:DUF4097 domain-containing protein [Bacteroidota bacterium]MCL5025654.1 DUF4097 domain-containing protein [Chloroflexota bacterium]
MNDVQIRVERVFRVDDGAIIWVVNYRGQVSVTGWDRPEVRVVAQKRGEDAFGRPDGRWVRGLEAEQDGSLIRLQAQAVPLPAAESTTLPRGMDIDLRTPRNVAVAVQSPNGLVVVGDIAGILFVRVGSGHVSLRRMAGQCLILGESGSCTGDWLRGELAFRLGGGSLQLRESILSRLDGETLTGDVEVQAFLSPAAPDGAYSVRSRSGSITLSVPPASNATLDLRSDTGQAQFLAPGEVLASNPGQRSVRIGRGGASISLHTTHGDIAVRSWQWEGEPPAPPLPARDFFHSLPEGAPQELALLRKVADGEETISQAIRELAALPPVW